MKPYKLMSHLLLIIFTVMCTVSIIVYFSYEDINKLPSDNWSNEVELFNFNKNTSNSSNFKDEIGITCIENNFIVISIENRTLKYRKFDLLFKQVDEGSIIGNLSGVEKIHIYNDDLNLTILLEKDDLFTFYTVSSDMELLSKDNDYTINNNNYHISSARIIVREDNNFRILSKHSDQIYTIFGNYYDFKAVPVDSEDNFKLIYISNVEGTLSIIESIYDEDGNVIKHNTISELGNQEKRLVLDKLIVYDENEIYNIIANLVDNKTGKSYIETFEYNKEHMTLTNTEIHNGILNTNGTSSKWKLTFSVKGAEYLNAIGNRYSRAYNLILGDLESGSLVLMTRTSGNPLNHMYVENGKQSYLIWYEKNNDNITVFAASSEKSIINKSTRFTFKKLRSAFRNSFDFSITLPFVIIAIGLFTFFIIMLPLIPLYLFKFSLIEKNHEKILGYFFLTHNIIIIFVHSNLDSLVTLPENLTRILPLLFVLMNILSILNYLYVKKRKSDLDLFRSYYSFSVLYIFFYSTLISPYVAAI